MKKRIASFALAFVMILTVVAAALPVFAAGSTSFTVTADKSEAKPGETINYTVTMDAVENLGGLVLELDIPEGLTFVEGSGKVAEGLQ